MNIIISNKYEALFQTIEIDRLQELNGTFSAEELSQTFKTTFYNKLIIDITAIKDYKNISSIQKLILAFPVDKLILLLDDSREVNDPVYLSQLVSMGIYNFTLDIKQVPYLLSNPNAYKDVAQYHMLGLTKEEIEKSKEAQEQAMQLAKQKVLGVINVTDHAGSTTLSFLLLKHLLNLYRVKAVELNKSDFTFFQEENLDSIQEENLKEYIDNNNSLEAIIVDLNEASEETQRLCTDIIYLVEPGIIQLNKVIQKDKFTFQNLYNKKLVLNRSILSNKDVEDFQRETGCTVFFNVPCVDDKLDNIKQIKKLLLSLGFTRFSNEERLKNFSLFK